MICPNCKCEYIRGVTQCADCGVALVDTLEPEPGIREDVRIVRIWRGGGEKELEVVAAALEQADIPHTRANTESLFGTHPNETALEIWVSEADRDKAEAVVSGLDVRLFPEELTPEEAADLYLPDSDGPDDSDDAAGDLWQEWHDDDPAIEVWAGGNEALADQLTMCLREIGTASRKLQEEERWRVVVRPEQEARAKEIVREVVEASPPE